MSRIIHLPSFGSVWETFVTHIRDAFLLDSRAVSAPALPCLMLWAQSTVSNRPNRVHRHISLENLLVQAPASVTPQHKETTYSRWRRCVCPSWPSCSYNLKKRMRRDFWGDLISVRCPDKAQVRVCSLGQVWQRSPAMGDRNKLFLEYRQGDRTAD
jgi:hypothetical protein